mmetsp:Transcript_57056/g.150333  ORF Transcript_57056/g.150333 Transcript_57056/m.150333 type:complete len:595 (-) Transcript_57056:1165-2949(-)
MSGMPSASLVLQGSSPVRLGISFESLRQFRDDHFRELVGKTTGQVRDDLIKRLTSASQLSFAEFCTRTPSGGQYSQYDFGPANLFVSHAWDYNFLELVAAIEDFVEQNPGGGTYFLWIDIFVVNQHIPSIPDFPTWSDVFKSTLRAVGRALFVLLPWDKPIWARRSWCLFEFFVACSCRIDLDFVIPRTERDRFVQSLCANAGNTFLRVAAKIDLAKAEAKYQSDRDHINHLVRKNIKFAVLNSKVVEQVRIFFMTEAVRALRMVGLSGEQHMNVLLNVAEFQMEVGELADAENTIRAHIDESERAGDDISEARGLEMLGRILMRQGPEQYEAARQQLDRSVKIQSRILGDDDLRVAQTRNNLASVLEKLDNDEWALAMYQKCLEIYEAHEFEGKVESIANIKGNIGNILMKSEHPNTNDLERARCMFVGALVKFVQIYGRNHEKVAIARTRLARVLSMQGKCQDAFEELWKSAKIFRHNFAEDHHRVVGTFENMRMFLTNANEVYVEEDCLQPGEWRWVGSSARVSVFLLISRIWSSDRRFETGDIVALQIGDRFVVAIVTSEPQVSDVLAHTTSKLCAFGCFSSDINVSTSS